MNAVRALYAYLVTMGATSENPGLDVKMPKKDAATRQLVTDDDLVKLLSAAEQQRTEFRVLRDKALLSVLIFCGLRRQELLDLTVRCVNLEGKCLLVQQGKGKKSRTIYPCRECLEALRDWLAFRATLKLPHDSLFVTMTRQRIGRTTFANTIEDIKAIAGFRGDPRIKPHSIRHAAATRLMRNGADIKSIQIWLGHSSLNTTAIYLHTDEDRARELSELAGFAGRTAGDDDPSSQSPPSRRMELQRRRRSAR
jgi:integrase/recombinase XerD